MKIWQNKIKEFLDFLIIIVILYGTFIFLGITCPIKFVFGISCPGCGMTRAWINAFKLDFKQAFVYHPLFMLPPIYIALYVFKNKISKRFYNLFMMSLCILFIVVYIMRLINPNDLVVVFEPKNGLIFRILYKLFLGG